MLNDRHSFHFVEKVRNAFDPLMMEHDFRCVLEQVTFVRYESNLLFVNVYHGRTSFELGIEVGRLACASEVQNAYSLSEIVRIFDLERAEQLRYYVARTQEGLDKGVRELFDLFAQYADEILKGNSVYFTRLKEQRAKWKTDYACKVLASQVRPKAEKAFRDNDFAEVVRLYESIIESLTSTEQKKLDFARQKMVSS